MGILGPRFGGRIFIPRPPMRRTGQAGRTAFQDVVEKETDSRFHAARGILAGHY